MRAPISHWRRVLMPIIVIAQGAIIGLVLFQILWFILALADLVSIKGPIDGQESKLFDPWAPVVLVAFLAVSIWLSLRLRYRTRSRQRG